ncbi:MAG: HalOD1 output domain-containing protein [Halorientalis sp.]
MSEAVVRLVSRAEDTDPLDLSPLGRTLDADALDAVFEPGAGSQHSSTRTLTFTYHGYTVTVDGGQSGQVRLVEES